MTVQICCMCAAVTPLAFVSVAVPDASVVATPIPDFDQAARRPRHSARAAARVCL